MKRWILSVCLLCLCASPLSACGQAGRPEAVTVIRYALWNQNQLGFMQRLAQMFERRHPGLKIQLEVTPPSQYFTNLETGVIGGGAPDIFTMNEANFLKYAEHHILLPLNRFVGEAGPNLADFMDVALSPFVIDGRLYALPKDAATVGLWYNKQLFRQAHLAFPDASWDWARLREAARRLTDPRRGIYGIAAPVADQTGFYNTILQSGGTILSADRRSSGFATASARAGLQFWLDLLKDRSSPTLEQMSDTAPLSLFEAGRLAMLYEGSWRAADFSANAYTRQHMDVTVLPHGKTRAVVVSATAMAINAATRYPQLAWEFIKFVDAQQAAQISRQTDLFLPVHKHLLTRWVKANQQFHLQAFVDELPNAAPYPFSRNTAAWLDLQNSILSNVWANRISLSVGTLQLAEQMNQILQEERQIS
ncbi:sugar ABC transporter substrate-binding protein [Ktedonosporobacter rubrisoli]|uniref:Sugar ABC transporter substrate-binding protein n=1 Tax=Ktedonosporobacter rubrisoli TaxID=2509675 RepID=A0A4V0YZZ3_KTERU|nr:sugar ABC transporter substrate-binding protein [Ktedonosporobacter rubrisoli]QBD81421.1 sugar ABC transporter substrate-binding protein [Ktedonosporobacter rubrisoli]